MRGPSPPMTCFLSPGNEAGAHNGLLQTMNDVFSADLPQCAWPTPPADDSTETAAVPPSARSKRFHAVITNPKRRKSPLLFAHFPLYVFGKVRIRLLLEHGSKPQENRLALPDFPFTVFEATPCLQHGDVPL
jgi:hypothetical protein